MKSNSKFAGVFIVAAIVSTIALKADDKAATTNTAAAHSASQPAAAPKLEDLFPDTPVAKGKDFQIMRSRLDETVSGMRSAYTSQGREISPADLPMLEKAAFDHLLEVELLKGKATDDDKAKAKIEADKHFALLRKSVPSEEALERQLKLMNLTLDQLHERLMDEAVFQQVLLDKVTVTDAEVKKFYDENASRFETPEMVRASHILISTRDASGAPFSDDEMKARRKMIDDLLKRARAGEDFAKLAREFSDDPGSKDKGGEYTFPRGQMVKEFESAAFSLQTNQISDVVTTTFGYHIIKLSEKIPAKQHALSEPDVKAYTLNVLQTQAIGKILPDLTVKLKKEANVEILDKQLKETLEAADEATKEAAKEKESSPLLSTPK